MPRTLFTKLALVLTVLMLGIPARLAGCRRIVVDRNRIGRFARYEDVEQLDLDRDTVFYQPAVRQGEAPS